MIVGPGVLVPAAVAGHLAAAIADYLVRTRIADPELSRLLEELQAVELVADHVAADVADGREPFRAPCGWLTIAEAVTAYGRPARTLRYQAAAGLVRARKEANRWLLEPPPDLPAPTPVASRGSSIGTS